MGPNRRRGVLPFLVGAAAAALGIASVATAGPGDRGGPCAALTAFEQGPWSRSALVALAEVVTYRSLNRDQPEGPGSAQVRVEKVFKGHAPGREFSFLVAGSRPTLDASDPSAPYLSARGGRYVFFLAQRAGGSAYLLEGLVDATGESGEERLRSIEAEVALLEVSDPNDRARRTLAHFLGELKATGTWTKVHAARELAHLATVRPDLFDGAARSRLASVLGGLGPPQQKTFLRETLKRLGHEAPPTATPSAPPTPGADPSLVERARRALAEAGEDRAARREVLVHIAGAGGVRAIPVLLALFRTEAPDARQTIAALLGESGVRSVVLPIRAAYANEPEADVRAAIVRAVGLLGGDDDLPWLGERLANPRLRSEVLFALARIRSERALALVSAEERRAAASTDEEDRALVRLIEHLRSPEFEAAERAAGRRVGPLPEDASVATPR